MKIVARAPGKIVLLGEYSVLEGASALVGAVDRYALAEIEPSDVLCEVDAPDILPEGARFKLDPDGQIHWQQPQVAEALALVAAAVAVLGERGCLPEQPWKLHLDSSAFFEHADGTRHKLGLGSSAAVTVALAGALAAFAGRAITADTRCDWLPVLRDIHHRFQDGRGSGLDIAAALYGGDIEFRLAPNGPQAEPVTWPAGLERIYVWSGHSASTAQFLGRLDAWRIASPRRYAKRMNNVAIAAELGVAAAHAGVEDWMLTAAADSAKALRKLGQASKIPICSADHAAIAKTVQVAGGVYKPCGAGGGDIGMALARGTQGKTRVVAALRAAGHKIVELGADRFGLTTRQDCPKTEEMGR